MEQSYPLIVVILLSSLTTGILGSLLFLGNQISQELKKRRRLQEVALYADMLRNTSNIYELLDSYITEKLEEYKIFNQEMFSKSTLTNAQQTQIARDVTVDIIDTMSPAFYSQLSVIFNPDTEKLQKLINNRVVMAVIVMTLELGGPLEGVI